MKRAPDYAGARFAELRKKEKITMDEIKRKTEKMFFAARTVSGKKKAVFIAVPLLILALFAHYHFSFKEQIERQETYGDFVRQEIRVNTGYNKLLSEEGAGDSPGAGKECAEADEYADLADMDTRNMSAGQIGRALELHPKCAYSFPNGMGFGLTYLNGEIARLSSLAEKIAVQKGKYERAEEVAFQWRQIAALLEAERRVLKSNADAMPAIWKTESEYSSGKINMAERNARIEKINGEIGERNARYVRILEKKKIALEKKNDSLRRFRRDAGFVNIPSFMKLPAG